MSPVEILAREHYRSIGLENGWTWQQVLNLCALMKISDPELAAMYGVTPTKWRHYRARGIVPTPVAIHFRILQGWFIERTIGTKAVPTVPADLLII